MAEFCLTFAFSMTFACCWLVKSVSWEKQFLSVHLQLRPSFSGCVGLVVWSFIDRFHTSRSETNQTGKHAKWTYQNNFTCSFSVMWWCYCPVICLFCANVRLYLDADMLEWNLGSVGWGYSIELWCKCIFLFIATINVSKMMFLAWTNFIQC